MFNSGKNGCFGKSIQGQHQWTEGQHQGTEGELQHPQWQDQSKLEY